MVLSGAPTGVIKKSPGPEYKFIQPQPAAVTFPSLHLQKRQNFRECLVQTSSSTYMTIFPIISLCVNNNTMKYL